VKNGRNRTPETGFRTPDPGTVTVTETEAVTVTEFTRSRRSNRTPDPGFRTPDPGFRKRHRVRDEYRSAWRGSAEPPEAAEALTVVEWTRGRR